MGETELDGQNVVSFYDFPTIERLQKDDVTDKLRKLGFGYRAAYVQKCAMQVKIILFSSVKLKIFNIIK